MKKLPIGIQTLSEIIDGGYVYIDKTQYIHQLINEGKYFFLSRPRRFGKSLLLDTIKQIYLGNKRLFEGLWIEENWNWEEMNPVVHLSFASMGYKEQGLTKALNRAMDEQASQEELVLEATTYGQKFKELIRRLHGKHGRKVVLLVDEYDKPIIDYLEKEKRPTAYEHRDLLKSFYSIIKDSDPHIEFLLITGVSKFSRVSIFSDLNNLTDITLDRPYAGMLGYTQQELEHYFADRIEGLVTQESIEKEDLLAKVKAWYNGYNWDGKTKVYNPFSILSLFRNGDFRNFWFATGTPTFLVDLCKEQFFYKVEGSEVDQTAFDSYTLDNMDLRSLLFQTGYLTIQEQTEFDTYFLNFPNREVRESMFRYLIGGFRHGHPADSGPLVGHLARAFQKNDIAKIVELIDGLFKDIPSHLFIANSEKYYHSLVHLTFRYLGVYIESEVHTNSGRMDAVVQTEEYIHILEFKLNKSAQEGLNQIREKDYVAKYRHAGKTIVGVGINFDSEKKAIDDWEEVIL